MQRPAFLCCGYGCRLRLRDTGATIPGEIEADVAIVLGGAVRQLLGEHQDAALRASDRVLHISELELDFELTFDGALVILQL